MVIFIHIYVKKEDSRLGCGWAKFLLKISGVCITLWHKDENADTCIHNSVQMNLYFWYYSLITCVLVFISNLTWGHWTIFFFLPLLFSVVTCWCFLQFISLSILQHSPVCHAMHLVVVERLAARFTEMVLGSYQLTIGLVQYWYVLFWAEVYQRWKVERSRGGEGETLTLERGN